MEIEKDQEEDDAKSQKYEPHCRPRIMADDDQEGVRDAVESEGGAGAHVSEHHFSEDGRGVAGWGIARSDGDSAEEKSFILKRPTGSSDSYDSDTQDAMGTSQSNR